MKKEKIPSTPAIRVMQASNISFLLRPYKYEERGGTEVAARELACDEHQTVKTLVMEDEKRNPLIVLMHGDREVSTKNLARTIGAKTVSPCTPAVAEKHTGYMVGGTSPFGLRKAMPIYVEESILNLPIILINAGRRGLLAEMDPADMAAILELKAVKVGI